MAWTKYPDQPSKVQPVYEPALQECAQCQSQKETKTSEALQPSKKARAYGRVISLEEYVADRVQDLSTQLTELEESTGVLMYRLIREADQAIARQLQLDIGRFDAEHARLTQRLRNEKRRLQLYAR